MCIHHTRTAHEISIRHAFFLFPSPRCPFLPASQALYSLPVSLMMAFTLYTHSGYFTKLRPHVRTFLEELSQLYNLYIYTAGDRQYAEAIADVLGHKSNSEWERRKSARREMRDRPMMTVPASDILLHGTKRVCTGARAGARAWVDG